jgi:hypothetical protein
VPVLFVVPLHKHTLIRLDGFAWHSFGSDIYTSFISGRDMRLGVDHQPDMVFSYRQYANIYIN